MLTTVPPHCRAPSLPVAQGRDLVFSSRHSVHVPSILLHKPGRATEAAAEGEEEAHGEAYGVSGTTPGMAALTRWPWAELGEQITFLPLGKETK